MGNLFVTVIIPTYHDWTRLQLCLDALSKQTYSSDFFEIVVVNNDPSDSIPYTLRVPSNTVLLEESMPGSYAARNAALGVAKGQVIAFTDSDCIPCADWLEKAVYRLGLGAERVAGKIELFYASSRLSWIEIYEKTFAFDQELSSENGCAVTANMITWMKNFNYVGFFNDELLSGGDIEWGRRAGNLGVPVVYDPDVVVKHPARSDIMEMKKKISRVAVGSLCMEKGKFRTSLVFLLLFGYLPSPKSIYRACIKENLSPKERFIAILMAYYFKIVANTIKILVKANFLAHPATRERDLGSWARYWRRCNFK